MTSRAAWLPLAILASAALLTGCGEEKPPPAIEFGAAKPAGDQIGLKPQSGTAVALSEWPDACKLVTDPEITAILPQAKDFERTPVKVTITNFNPLKAADPSTVGDVPRGGCEFEFALPAGKDKSARNSSFTVTVTAVADPALVAARYAEDKKKEAGDDNEFKDLAAAWGTKGCYSYGGALNRTAECYQGPYLFEVTGSSSAGGLGPNPGKKATLNETTAAEKQRYENWINKVLTPVVQTVGARMS
ncbi:hypothetical protein OG474_22500 [Kribbella sp. NBC_01505]|uniref:hypothetical protein n=1 Tax=Kribbella sp. NBC_01505 TaxID=2903580 RepID=UPI00386713B6